MSITYRFSGDSTEVFPFVERGDGTSIAWVADPGSTIEGAPGLVHPRVQRRDGDAWVDTLEPAVPPAVAGAEPVGRLEDLTVTELRALARERGVDVGGAPHKADLVAALRAEAKED